MGGKNTRVRKSQVSPSSSNGERAGKICEQEVTEQGIMGRSSTEGGRERSFISPDSALSSLPENERNILLAAAYIEDAKLGRGSYGRVQYYFKGRHMQIAFRIVTSQPFQILIYLTVILHACLTFFEPPSTLSLHYRENIAAILLNLVCLMMYSIDIFLIVSFLSFITFLKSVECTWGRVELVLLCLFTVDWLLLVIQVSVFSATENPAVGYIVQPFRCLRLAMIVCKAKNVAHVLVVMFSITVKLGKLLFVMVVYVLIFSSIGSHLLMPFYHFHNDTNQYPKLTASVCMTTSSNSTSLAGEPSACQRDSMLSLHQNGFNNIGIASVNLFVLFTTENYPSFIFPSFVESPVSWLFFGVFISIGVFLLAPLLLAVIADLYWEYNKKNVKKERMKQRQQLIEAWNLLDPGNKEYLPVDSTSLCSLFRILKPKNSDEENRELLSYLDPDNSGYIDWVQWVTELLFVLDLEKSGQSTQENKSAVTCCASVSGFCERLTTWKHFNRAVLCLIILYCLLFLLIWEGIDPIVELVVQVVRTVIAVVFCGEIFLRVLAAGQRILKKKKELIEMSLVLLGLCSNVIWYGWYALDPGPEDYQLKAYYWKGSCTVLSSLVIFARLLFNSAQTKRALQLLLQLFPVIWDLLILFMIVVYTYAVIGMESFRHIAVRQPVQHCYEYYKYGCGVGFINFTCSLLMVFQIITTNNWHDIMYAVIENAGTYAPVIYFVPCFIIINLILMNLLISIGLEAVNYFTKRTDQLDGNDMEGPDKDEQIMTDKDHNVKDHEPLSSRLKERVLGCLKSMKGYIGAAFSSARGEPGDLELSFSPQHSTQPSRIQSSKLLSRANSRVHTGKGRRDMERDLALLRLPIPECVTPAPSLDESSMLSDSEVSETGEIIPQQSERQRVAQTQRKSMPSQSSESEYGDMSQLVHQEKTAEHPGKNTLFSTAHAIRSLNPSRKRSNDSNGSAHRKNSVEETDKGRSQMMKGHFHVRKKVNWRTEIQDMTLINSKEFQELRERLREASIGTPATLTDERNQESSFKPSVSRIEEGSESAIAIDLSLSQSTEGKEIRRDSWIPESHSSGTKEHILPVFSIQECEESSVVCPSSTSGSELHSPQTLSNSLTVPVPTPKSYNWKQAKKGQPTNSSSKSPTGFKQEIPDWVKKFANSNNLSLTTDAFIHKDDDSEDYSELDSESSGLSSHVDVFDIAAMKPIN